MANQSDRNMEESPTAGPEVMENGAPVQKGRLRRSFGFLGSFTFWVRLGVGLVILGAGVLIGLGIAWFIDDQGADDYGRRDGNFFAFQVDPSGEWMGGRGFRSDGEPFPFSRVPGRPSDWEKAPDPGDYPERGPKGSSKDDSQWQREGWKKEWPQADESTSKGFADEKGFYLPPEIMELAEELFDELKQLIEEIGQYLEEGRFGPGMEWPRQFFGGDDGLWNGDEQDEDRPGDPEDEDGVEEYQEEDEESYGPFPGTGFPFGEFLPGLAFLEDCELDFQSLLGIMEDLPNFDDEQVDGEEDLDKFFGQFEELFEEICETPSEG